MINPQTLKGFRDFLPAEARRREYVKDILKDVFESYGFEPLETPTLEYEEILMGKYGEEGDKLLYRFTDNGDRRVAMRYDQTVPLARVIAQYQNELAFPFKRYQMQNVFRAENTQKGRFREFMQCDIDTVGSASPLADAEIIAVTYFALKKLGFENPKILVNDRSIFTNLTDHPDNLVPEDKLVSVIRTIDKLKKIGKEAVVTEIVENGIQKDKAEKILEELTGTNIPERLTEVLRIAKELGIPENCLEFFPALARGLDYYTATIFEIEIPEYPVGSIGGGGRYDKLLGMFAKESLPACGFAFGFDRVMEAMTELNLFPIDLQTAEAQILVTVFNPELVNSAVELTAYLRNAGIKAEMYLDDNTPLDKQLKYAVKREIPYLAIIGPDEVSKKSVVVKDLLSRTQETLSFEELVVKFAN